MVSISINTSRNCHWWMSSTEVNEGKSSLAYPMQSNLLSGKIKSYQKSQSREDRRLSHQGISNARVKAQWSHFKGIEILWSDCVEDQSVIRPVGKEITATGLCKIAALWSEKNRKANYSLSANGAQKERLYVTSGGVIEP